MAAVQTACPAVDAAALLASTSAALRGQMDGTGRGEYHRLVQMFNESNTEMKCLMLNALTHSTAVLHPKQHRVIIDAVLAIDWAENPDLMAGCRDFMLNATASNVDLLAPCLKVVMRKFLRAKPKAEMAEGELERDEAACKAAHKTLKKILAQFPTGLTVLLPLLVDAFPHKRHDAELQGHFLSESLKLLRYAPALTEPFLCTCVDRLIAIDVEIKADFEAEEEDDHEGMFDLELEIQEQDQAEQIELAGKMDLLLDILFQWVLKQLQKGGEFAEEVFRVLCVAFETMILTTHQSKFSQFLLFVAVSVESRYLDTFLSRMLHTLMDPARDSSSRIAAVCYIGSLLARADFVLTQTTRTSLSFVANWLHQYLALQSPEMLAHPQSHMVFYAAAQNLFYVLCYRLRDFNADERAFFAALRLDELILCPLQPLRMILADIALEFIRAASLHRILAPPAQQLADATAQVVQPGESQWGAGQFEAFFPFDPYSLKISSRWVDPLYRNWSQDEDDDAGLNRSDSAASSLANREHRVGSFTGSVSRYSPMAGSFESQQFGATPDFAVGFT